MTKSCQTQSFDNVVTYMGVLPRPKLTIGLATVLMSIGRGVIIIFLCRKLFITNHRNKECFFFVSHHSATARLFRRRADDLTMREFLNVSRRGIRIIRTPMASLTSAPSVFVAAIISFTMMRSLLVFKAPFAVGFISHRRSLFMMRRSRP